MTEALRPSEKQLRFMDWEFGVFFHFGIRSFFPCHTDWDNKPMPAECDCMLRDTWFDCADNENSVKTAEELMGMYEMSVGRGANFLLNIGPTATACSTKRIGCGCWNSARC